MNSPDFKRLLPVIALGMFLPLGGTLQAQSDTTQIETGVRAIATGGRHTCAISDSGAVWCWGQNTYGQLGDGTDQARLVPTRVTGLEGRFVDVAVGWHHSCALQETGRLYCWGRNQFGQLGQGNLGDSFLPRHVAALRESVTAVSSGLAHVCAIGNNGRTRCWGWNADGQLGDGTRTNRTLPVNVARLGNDVAMVSAGNYHSCAIDAQARAQCWGRGTAGQLGNGTQVASLVPSRVQGLGRTVTAVAAGSNHTCFLDRAGRASCAGRNTNGQLGIGEFSSATIVFSTPQPVLELGRNLRSITAGGDTQASFGGHSCVVNQRGRPFCWGSNNTGEIGSGFTPGQAANFSRPTAVVDIGNNVRQIAPARGGNHTCFIAGNGRAFCSGLNFDGQLGDGTTTTASAPVAVAGNLHRR